MRISWRDFANKMEEHHGDLKVNFRLLQDKYEALKQGNKSLQTYFTEKQSMWNRLRTKNRSSAPNEEQHWRHVEKGLDVDKYQRPIWKMAPNAFASLTALESWAYNLEQNEKYANKSKEPKGRGSGRQNDPPGDSKSRGGRNGNQGADQGGIGSGGEQRKTRKGKDDMSGMSGKERKRRKDDKACFKCGKADHFRKDCQNEVCLTKPIEPKA